MILFLSQDLKASMFLNGSIGIYMAKRTPSKYNQIGMVAVTSKTSKEVADHIRSMTSAQPYLYSELNDLTGQLAALFGFVQVALSNRDCAHSTTAALTSMQTSLKDIFSRPTVLLAFV
jgi:hypothetical protein